MGLFSAKPILKMWDLARSIVEDPRRAVVVILAVAILARLIIGLSTAPILTPDSFVYYDWARSISYKLRVWPIVTYRTPLYSAYMAIFIRGMGQSEATGNAIVFSQYLMGVLSTLLLYRLILRHFSKTSAFFAALIFTTSPLVLFYEAVIQTETIFILIFFCAVTLMVEILKGGEPWIAALLGVTCGALSLTRPVAQLFPFVFLAALLFKRLPLRNYAMIALLTLLAYGATIFPWIQTNKYAFDRWTLAQLSGVNLFHRVFDIDRFAPTDAPEFADMRELLGDENTHRRDKYFLVLDRLTKSLGSPVLADERMFEFAVASLKLAPLRFFVATGGHYLDLFLNPDRTIQFCATGGDRQLCSPSTRHRSTRVFKNQPKEWGFKFRALTYKYFSFYDAWIRFEFFAFLAVLGTVVAMHRDSPRRGVAAFLVFVILYFIAVTGAVGDADDRFRLPLDGLIYALAALGVEAMWRNRKELYRSAKLDPPGEASDPVPASVSKSKPVSERGVVPVQSK